MKIVHISTTERTGGAAIAANRLHKAMLRNSIDSQMLVLRRNSNSSLVKVACNSRWQRINGEYIKPIKASRVKYNRNQLGQFSSFDFGTDISTDDVVRGADVIYLHWVNDGFQSFDTICKILELGKPTYWLMHDMFPITGGCNYSFGCEEYTRNCSGCKYFDMKLTSGASKQFARKARLKEYKNLHWIAPSKWLYDCASKSGLVDVDRLYHLPLIISPAFQPMDASVARELLGLPQDKKIILAGADNILGVPYKGWNEFREAIQSVYKRVDNARDMEVVLFGAEYIKEGADSIPFKSTFLGQMSDEYSMNLIYNAADFLVASTMMDNYPQTIAESLCSGTPVVGFKTGGIVDMIEATGNGVLCEQGNTEELAEGILKMLETSNEPNLSYLKEFANEVELINQHKALWDEN